jgi:hypothetical protein
MLAVAKIQNFGTICPIRVRFKLSLSCRKGILSFLKIASLSQSQITSFWELRNNPDNLKYTLCEMLTTNTLTLFPLTVNIN